MLLEYVKNVQPEFMEVFVKRAPQQVFVFIFPDLLLIRIYLTRNWKFKCYFFSFFLKGC